MEVSRSHDEPAIWAWMREQIISQPKWAAHRLGIEEKGAEKRFRDLRERAKVPAHVTSSDMRDGAATAMASAGISDKLFAVLMGHRSGIGDHYTKRNPQMVRPACDAIRARYLG